jgi:hypothetical protein
MEISKLTKVNMSRILHEYHIEIAYSYQHRAYVKAKLKCLCTVYRTLSTWWMFIAMEP